MAQLGIPLRDAELFDVATYLEILDIQTKMLGGEKAPRRATQKDIDLFLL